MTIDPANANIATLGVAIDPTPAEAGAKRASAAAKSVGSSLEALAKAAMDAAKAMHKSSDDSAGAFAKLIANARKMASMVTGFFGSVVSGAVGMVKGITNAFAQIGLAIDGVNKLLTPVKGIFNFLTGAVAQAAKLEQITTGLRGLLGGSGSAANGLMGQFQTLGLQTPFELEELSEAGRILLAMGGSAKTVTDELRRMGDVTASIPGGSLKEIALLFGKMRQDGRIMAVDITQLANHGLPVLQEFAKILSKETGKKVRVNQVRDMASEGLIEFRHLEQAFKNMTSEGGFAYKAMILQSETWNGKLSNLADAWNKLKVTIGQPIIDGLRPGLDLLIGEVGKLDEFAQAIGPKLREAALAISAAFKVATEPGGLELSFKAAADFLKNSLRRIWEATGILMGQIFDRVLFKFTQGMKALASRQFWEGVGEALVSGVQNAMQVMGDYAKAQLSGKKPADVTADRIREEYTARNPAIREIEAANRQIESNYNDMEKLLRPLIQAGLGSVQAGSLKPSEFEASIENLRNSMLMEVAIKNQPLYDKFSAEDRAAYDEMIKALNKIYSAVREKSLVDLNAEAAPQVESFGDIFARTEDAPSADRNSWWSKFTDAFGWAKDSAAARDAATGSGPESILLPPVDGLGGSGTGSGAPGSSWDNPIDLTEQASAQKSMADDAERWRDAIKTPREELTESLKGYDDARRANLLTEDQYQKLRLKAEQKYQDSLETTTQQETARTDKQLSEHQKLIRSWAQLQKQIDQVSVGAAQSITGNMSQALTDLVTGTKSAKDAFGDMANAIVKDIVKMITQMLVQIAYAKILGWITGTPTASIGSMFSTALGGGNILAGVRHEGGPAEGGPTRSVPSFAFAFAPRMHSGGVVGSDEVPTILQKGETVLTRDQARNIRNRIEGGESDSGGSGVTIINVLDPGLVADFHAKNPDAILNIISPKVAQMRTMLGKR